MPLHPHLPHAAPKAHDPHDPPCFACSGDWVSLLEQEAAAGLTHHLDAPSTLPNEAIRPPRARLRVIVRTCADCGLLARTTMRGCVHPQCADLGPVHSRPRQAAPCPLATSHGLGSCPGTDRSSLMSSAGQFAHPVLVARKSSNESTSSSASGANGKGPPMHDGRIDRMDTSLHAAASVPDRARRGEEASTILPHARRTATRTRQLAVREGEMGAMGKQKNVPPGMEALHACSRRKYGFSFYRGSVLVLTFLCYTGYHASRKPPSIVKR